MYAATRIAVGCRTLTKIFSNFWHAGTGTRLLLFLATFATNQQRTTSSTASLSLRMRPQRHPLWRRRPRVPPTSTPRFRVCACGSHKPQGSPPAACAVGRRATAAARRTATAPAAAAAAAAADAAAAATATQNAGPSGDAAAATRAWRGGRASRRSAVAACRRARARAPPPSCGGAHTRPAPPRRFPRRRAAHRR